MATVVSDSALHCILVNWTLGDERPHAPTTRPLTCWRAPSRAQRQRSRLPDGQPQDRRHGHRRSGDAGRRVHLDRSRTPRPSSPARTVAAIERYLQGLLPPFAAALARYDREREYSWAAPGHQGGVAFLKSPVGRVFFDFYGENLFRTDMGIERGALGSLLGHSGPVGESERYAARVFGAHRSTRCSTAPRAPTAPSCRPAWATTRSRSATATATSPSSRAWRSPAASRCS